MATLILSAVGTAIGGPLGGALGALIGQQFDSAMIGRRKVDGPRLKELWVQTSSYGSAIPLQFGTVRAAGSVIWATELVEHEEHSGGGKSRPSVTSYSYTASFAVAISSRPIVGVGRIWADGNLLRGSAGDLKVGGTMRVHTGHGDQQPDTLLVQAEGSGRCPAYRNTAYVVFEDLQLADYGNRLPSLTFEVIADEGEISLADICDILVDDAAADGLTRAKLAGFSVDQGTAADYLPVIGEIAPITCSVRNERLTFELADMSETTDLPLLPLPCAGGETAEDARQDGWSLRREALPASQQCAVRYYDVARDYQPGLQRSIGRSAPGDVVTIDLPAAMSARRAIAIADLAAQRRTLAHEALRYRITEVDSDFSPGRCVKTPVTDGIWRIDQWEWQADGVMLELSRVPTTAPLAEVADSGRANSASDMPAVPSQIIAAELPWDGSGDGTTPYVRVFATAESAGWAGASLFAEQIDGTLQSIGFTGRRRATAGTALTALAAASPLLLDRTSVVDVQLAASDLALANATWAQLMQGANLALLGPELVQFARAERTSATTWRLSILLRGRGGTEHNIAEHVTGEPFTMLRAPFVSIDDKDLGPASVDGIIALGIGDSSPARSPVINAGLTMRPLSPVHGTAALLPDGALHLQWVRRARGAWNWRDEVDAPLNEAEELWEIAFGPADNPTHLWRSTASNLAIAAPLAQSLAETSILQPGSSMFAVRQIGRQSKSLPLSIAFSV